MIERKNEFLEETMSWKLEVRSYKHGFGTNINVWIICSNKSFTCHNLKVNHNCNAMKSIKYYEILWNTVKYCEILWNTMKYYGMKWANTDSGWDKW